MQLGLIGHPLGHSKSPEIFAQIFKQSSLKGSYTLFPLEIISNLREWLNTQPSLVGFNVTIPHKQTIIPLLDSVSEEAKAIGAVNTVKIERTNGTLRLHGYNTDCLGFKTSLLNFIDEKQPLKALVLGSGGSSKAVGYELERLGISFSMVSRGEIIGYFSYNKLSRETIKQHHLIINTTPLGMHPNVDTAPLIDYSALTTSHFLFDLVYNPIETQFLLKGKAQGANTKNGLEMLHLQAQESWQIWNS